MDSHAASATANGTRASRISRSPLRIPFVGGLHGKFLRHLDANQDTFEYAAIEHLKVSGVYWAMSSAQLLGYRDLIDVNKAVAFVTKCQSECGGFGGNVGHDPHLLYTLSALQILCLADKLAEVDADKVSGWVCSL